MSKQQKPDWKSSLAGIRGNLPKGTSGGQSRGESAKKTGGGTGLPNFSTRVFSKERAGRAPYNFVPAPERVRTDAEPPPTADRYHAELLSGEIVLRIEALTNFYLRGMWRLKDYEERQVGDKPVQVKDQVEPFGIDSELRIPGSSLRGMLRTLVEILSDAPLEPVNDSQLFFRAVGASSDPSDNSFEPHATIYKERIVSGSGASREDPTGPRAQVGYLHASKDGWKIQPACKHDTYRTQWYRVERQTMGKKSEGMYKIWFKPAKPIAATYPHRRFIHYRFGTVTDFCDRTSGSPPEGYEPGWLICSGHIQRKYLQWIVHEEDRNAPSLDVPDYDVTAYKESGISYWLEDHRQLAYHEGDEVKPCFYVEWKDDDGRRHVSFGHTPYFRLPYKTTPHKANPARRRAGDTGWSLAEAIFGRVKPGEPGKTRVFVEDGFLIERPKNQSGAQLTTVLGTPKPTTYQHYLVQQSERKEDSIHWDDPRARLRGHKLYWHRPGAEVKQAGPKQEKVATKFCPASAGAVFEARIRYENLRVEELGALLTALELPQGCAHKLGMGKPIGLGSFRISVKEMREINRLERYTNFCDAGAVRLVTGATPATQERPVQLKNCFAAWKTGDDSANGWQRLWEDPRLAELKALLTYDGLPVDRKRWTAMTRYLEFGKVHIPRNPPDFLYNEYTHVDQAIGSPWPPPVQDGRRRPSKLEPRRPLPPASQVLEEANKPSPMLPADPRPPFVEE
jgi:CRISPR-associated protein (TIGR03986 family)